MKPAWMRRHFACPDCGLVIHEVEALPKPEGWAKPYLDLPAVPFDCERCKVHYVAEEFFQLNEDKWKHEMEPENQP